ncbi:hypothetical protein HDU98_000029 [Podochytrium sp. JEL0797]|nr:hypothetical protein HDU98_000029 [Podochytrium sp. JEL0797]
MATYHQVLLPGQTFPALSVNLTTGEKQAVKAEGGKSKLVVIYRGQFCPFCQGTMKQLTADLPKLAKAGIELIAISADAKDKATQFVSDLKIPFPVAYGLEPAQMKVLGTFVSVPTDYIEQKQVFSEPAWFFLTPENQIKYLDYGSAPFSARPVVDALIAGVDFSNNRAKEVPNFKKYVWGSHVLQ